ncbi:MAG: enoyl-CoA hydratase/isomerase family protein [Alphaproteobacteria bacterium]|jgi:enoyl-CoA hydratase/carnithine racemase
MTGAVHTDISEGIGTLTLSRPAKLNAWDGPMRAEVQAVLQDWTTNEAVRTIIVTGDGDRAFSAGQDLDETEKFTSGDEGAAWFHSWRAFYDALRDLDKPSVAALNGVAAGSAFQFAMLTDVRVGHPGSTMGQPEINSGIPSVLGPMLMRERIAYSRTVELVLMGRMMTGEEAAAAGLIHYLVETPEQMMPKAREVAAELASKPPIAMRLTKQRFRAVTQDAYEEAFANGAAVQAEAYASGEPQAAMREFFAVRAARREQSR